MTATDRPAADADFGALERGDGEVTLRFTRHLQHPPDKVWRALTQAGHLAAWFPTTIEGDFATGAQLQFSFRDLQVPPMDGTMLSCDPPKLLEFTWGDERLRFELTADHSGTTLGFTASFAGLGKAARDGAGWHVCLDLLGCDVAGQQAAWTSDERWRQLIGSYQARFGPDASVEGPPAAWEDAHGPAES